MDLPVLSRMILVDFGAYIFSKNSLNNDYWVSKFRFFT